MYEAHYGLNAKPFQLNPDPGFYFDSKQHRRAKAYLEYGVMRNEGFIVITGEIGAGKTTILSGLLANLERDDVVVGQLVTTQLDAEDTLRMVGAAFGVKVQGASKSEILIMLEAFLTHQATLGKRCLLIVDEAQNLTPRAVEELRMISNYQLGTQSLLQSFLVGQPEFRMILQRREMEQFRQRVAATCHLGPLDLEDTEAYIQHRLKTAGATDRPTFDEGVFEAVHQASQGIPRRINLLCDRVLLLGFLQGRTHLTVDDVHEVARELTEESGQGLQREPLASHVNGNDLRTAEQPSVGNTASASDTASAGRTLQHTSNETPRPSFIDTAGLDAELARWELDGDVAEAMDRQIRNLTNGQQVERLQRLERSVLRLERMNLELLMLMRQLVHSARRAPEPEEGTL